MQRDTRRGRERRRDCESKNRNDHHKDENRALNAQYSCSASPLKWAMKKWCVKKLIMIEAFMSHNAHNHFHNHYRKKSSSFSVMPLGIQNAIKSIFHAALQHCRRIASLSTLQYHRLTSVCIVLTLSVFNRIQIDAKQIPYTHIACMPFVWRF